MRCPRLLAPALLLSAIACGRGPGRTRPRRSDHAGGATRIARAAPPVSPTAEGDS